MTFYFPIVHTLFMFTIRIFLVLLLIETRTENSMNRINKLTSRSGYSAENGKYPFRSEPARDL